jgi:hypothetical protein
LRIRTPAKFGLVTPSGQPVRRPKVDVGYPAGGSVTLAFHASMLRMLSYETQKGDDRLLAKVNHTQGLYVGDNRNMLAEQFMAGTSDWLLQIDTDIEFPANLLDAMVMLAGEDRKVIAASVPLGSTYPTCAFLRTEYPGVWASVPRFDGMIECDGVATAVVMIHREVFEAIEEKFDKTWFHHMYIPLSDRKYRSQGEDLAFSMKAADCGVRIYCANVPGLRHHKTTALSHDEVSADPGVGTLVEVAEERPVEIRA